MRMWKGAATNHGVFRKNGRRIVVREREREEKRSFPLYFTLRFLSGKVKEGAWNGPSNRINPRPVNPFIGAANPATGHERGCLQRGRIREARLYPFPMREAKEKVIERRPAGI